MRTVVVLILLAALFGDTRPSAASTSPAEPHAQVASEVMAFLMSDVGTDGILTMDGDPLGEPVPPYFYHFAIKPNDVLRSNTSGYPGYESISYPGYTMSVAIDAFLAWWAYSGDANALQRAIDCADWLLPRRTPSGDLYGDWVYSTQTDGVMGGGFDGEAVMSDKPGMFARRLVRLHDITGDVAYVDAAQEIADTYVATQQTGGPENAGRWPFRIRPSDGEVTQDYTSHLVPAIELLTELESRFPGNGYGASATEAWNWLWANPLEPTSADYMHWEGFYEDIGPESAGLFDHYGAENTITSLVRRALPGDAEKAIEILDWSTDRYLAPDGPQDGWGLYAPALLEWDAWPNSTFAANGQWAYVNLLLDEATEGTPLHDAAWRPRAIEALHTLTWGQDTRNTDGRMFTSIRQMTNPDFTANDWYEQSFNTVIYLLLGMGIATELAPDTENHLLRFDGGELAGIEYLGERIRMNWSAPGRALLKLVDEPAAVKIDGVWHPDPGSTQWADASGNPGWSWDGASQVCIVGHASGEVDVLLGAATAAPMSVPHRSARLLSPTPNPFNPRVSIPFELTQDQHVRLAIVDARGRRVVSLLNERRRAGRHQVIWGGVDGSGRSVASGSYRVVLRGEGHQDSRPVVLVR